MRALPSDPSHQQLPRAGPGGLCAITRSSKVNVLRCTHEGGRSQTKQERLVMLKKRLDLLDRTCSTGNSVNLSSRLCHACRGTAEFPGQGGK